MGVTASSVRLPAMICGDGCRLIPLARWDVDDFSNKSVNALETRFGSFINGEQNFDAAAFKISRCAVFLKEKDKIKLPIDFTEPHVFSMSPSRSSKYLKSN